MKLARTILVLSLLLILPNSALAGVPPTYETSWGGPGNGDGLFQGPFGIAVGDNGDLYVTDFALDRIQVFDSSGDYLYQWGTSGTGAGQFDNASNVGVDSNGDIYVTDRNNHRVQKFDRDGNYLTSWGGFGLFIGQFDEPSSVAADASGNVYVTDFNNYRVQKFDSDGNFLTQWGSNGIGNGSFLSPTGVAVDAFGDVYVADFGSTRIQKFDENGVFLLAWGSAGSGDGEFLGPAGVCIDRYGYVYVSDQNNDRVQKFDSTGNFIAKWGSTGTGEGQFAGPSGITVDRDGNVYVVDQGNDRVQKFRHAPLINTVRDVPGDEGLSVYLSWFKSPLDVSAPNSVAHYTLWRAIAPVSAASFSAENSFEGVDPDIRIQQLADRVFFWELMDSVDAYALEGYGKPVPTMFDSTAVSFEQHYFQVMAHTQDPSVFYASSVDSGYSVDNLVPDDPTGLMVVYGPTNYLTWEPSSAPDFAWFNIYRISPTPSSSSTAELVHSTAELAWEDTGGSWGYDYRFSVVDDAGNESALAPPESVTAVNDAPVQRVTALVGCSPNPFNPHTTITYSLGEPGNAELVVYDLAGRRVKTLVSGHVEAGRHEAPWDGRDEQGRRVASGVYLYRLVAGEFGETKRMVLLK